MVLNRPLKTSEIEEFDIVDSLGFFYKYDRHIYKVFNRTSCTEKEIVYRIKRQ